MKTLKTLGILAVAMTATASFSQEILFSDNFETNDFSKWNVGAIGATPNHAIVTDPVYRGQYAAQFNPPASGTGYVRFGSALSRVSVPGDNLVLSFYMYDPYVFPSNTASGRQYLELRDYAVDTVAGTLGSGVLNQLIAFGTFNSGSGVTGLPGQFLNNGIVGDGVAPTTQNANMYRARLISVAPGSGVPGFGAGNNAPNWVTLGQDPVADRRSEGWHRMVVAINDNRVEFYEDGKLGFFWDHNRPIGIDAIILGSGLGSSTIHTFDNVKLENWAPLTVNVHVNLENTIIDPSQKQATLELIDGGGNTVATNTAFLNSDGNISVVAPAAGTYSVRVTSVAGFLSRLIGNVNVTALGSHGLVFGMRNGDVDANDEVGPSDFALLANAFGTELGGPGFLAAADLDGNDEVGPSDFAILSSNFGQEGDQP